MNIPYRHRRFLSHIGIILMVLLLILTITWLCWVVWLERYIVYTRDGAVLDLEVSANTLTGEVATPPVADTSRVSIYYNEGEDAIETSNAMTQLNGYFISSTALTNNIASSWEALDHLSSGTPVMIDLKGGYGSFYFSSNLPGAIASASISTASVDEIIKDMKDKGFYTIARISAFRDYEYGRKNVANGLMHINRKGLWPDEGGCYWLNPTEPAVLNWISSMVNELKGMGFDEVVLADFRFPAGDSYVFNGDKDAAIQQAAATIYSNVADPHFCLSFSVSNPTFVLPQGRCRMYLEGVSAENVGSRTSMLKLEEPQIRLVFVAETNDTRYDAYGVLRPIDSAQQLEAQKIAMGTK